MSTPSEARGDTISTAVRQVREHRVIRAAIHCACNVLDRVEATGTVADPDLYDLWTFFGTYVESWHVEYEEAVLLPYLYRTFGDFMSEPMHRVLTEHEGSRGEWRAVDAAYHLVQAGDAGAFADLSASFRRYLERLGEHVRTEDGYLINALDTILTPEEHDDLETRIVAVEARSFGRGMPALLEEKVRRLCATCGAHWPFHDDPSAVLPR
jgi:hemerythrin-like domain-containing protein